MSDGCVMENTENRCHCLICRASLMEGLDEALALGDRGGTTGVSVVMMEIMAEY